MSFRPPKAVFCGVKKPAWRENDPWKKKLPMPAELFDSFSTEICCSVLSSEKDGVEAEITMSGRMLKDGFKPETGMRRCLPRKEGLRNGGKEKGVLRNRKRFVRLK